jgi:hypothetical protein
VIAVHLGHPGLAWPRFERNYRFGAHSAGFHLHFMMGYRSTAVNIFEGAFWAVFPRFFESGID